MHYEAGLQPRICIITKLRLIKETSITLKLFIKDDHNLIWYKRMVTAGCHFNFPGFHFQFIFPTTSR